MTADILDISIIVLILLSTIVGLVTGFIKESLTLATLITATAVAALNAKPLAADLPIAIDSQVGKLAIAFGVIFLVILIVGLVVSYLLSSGIRAIGLGGFDHALGAVFGFFLGAMLVTLAVMVLMSGKIAKNNWWVESRLIPYFEQSAVWVNANIPPSLSQYIDQYVQKSSSDSNLNNSSTQTPVELINHENTTNEDSDTNGNSTNPAPNAPQNQ
jgi:membrane protein required for colicin V production